MFSHSPDILYTPEKLIAVSGKRRHGKDSIGAFLVGKGFKRYAFADQVRRLLYNTNPAIGVNRSTFQIVFLKNAVDSLGWDQVKQMPEVVRLQQKIATEGCREIFGEDTWVIALERLLMKENPQKIVITDLRFKNEAEWVRTNGGYVIRVNRPDAEPTPETLASHVSETDLDDWPHFDAIINNDFDLVGLKEKIDILIQAIDRGDWVRGGTL